MFKANVRKKIVILVNEAYTSEGCGNLYKIKSSKIYKCKKCFEIFDRDTNSAKNINCKKNCLKKNENLEKNYNMIDSKAFTGIGLAISSVGLMYYPLRYIITIRRLRKRLTQDFATKATAEEAAEDTFAMMLGSVSFLMLGKLVKLYETK